MNYLVVVLQRGQTIPAGTGVSGAAFPTQEAALKQAAVQANNPAYEVRVYTLAAKIGRREMPVITDTSVAVSLDLKEV